jgi:hypothetical protein
MRYARSLAQAIVGTLLFIALLGVMLVVMIERVEVAVAGDECAGFAQQDFEAGIIKDMRGRK